MCRAVKWKKIVDDERLKDEELGGGENYSRDNRSIERKREREGVTEISAGDQMRLKTAHSQH